jgi:hypothetical protein
MSDVRHLLWKAALVAGVGAVGAWVTWLGWELVRRPDAIHLVSRLGQWKPVILKHGIAAGLLGVAVLVTGVGLARIASQVLGEPDRGIHPGSPS